MMVILDRDGVINYDSSEYIKAPDEWVPIPGSLEAIASLKRAGHQVVIATNQSGVGRGLLAEQTLHDIHAKMQRMLSAFDATLDGIYYCPHAPKAQCECRKPKPGLLKQIANEWHIDLHQAVMIGDSLRDVEAAQAVGVQPVVVLTGHGQATTKALNGTVPCYADLAQAVASLI